MQSAARSTQWKTETVGDFWLSLTTLMASLLFFFFCFFFRFQNCFSFFFIFRVFGKHAILPLFMCCGLAAIFIQFSIGFRQLFLLYLRLGLNAWLTEANKVTAITSCDAHPSPPPSIPPSHPSLAPTIALPLHKLRASCVAKWISMSGQAKGRVSCPKSPKAPPGPWSIKTKMILDEHQIQA